MSLLHHHSLLAYPTSAAFDPLSITWNYYNQATQTFSGSNYVDSLIKNAYALSDYWHIWLKTSIADGRPAAQTNLWGGATVSNTQVRTQIDTGGTVRVLDGGVGRASTAAFANGAIGNTLFHVYRDNVKIAVEIDTVDWPLSNSTNLTKPVNQTTRNMYYGAYNNNGTTASYFTGTALAIYVWGGTSNLTAQQISDMNTYMTNL